MKGEKKATATLEKTASSTVPSESGASICFSQMLFMLCDDLNYRSSWSGLLLYPD